MIKDESLTVSSSPAGRSPAALVWAIWAALLAAGLWLVKRYGFRMPVFDEWHAFDVLMGVQPLTLEWLWAPLNEHRMLLPRLVYLGITWASGYRFHAAAYVSFILLAAAAAAFVLTARRLRGCARLSDAFFPLLLLNWGAVTNLPWGFEICFALPAALSALALVVVARCGRELTLGAAALLTAILLAAGLCGAFSLPFLPTLGVWLLYAALRRFVARRETPHALRDASLMIVMALALFGLAAFYFMGLARPAHHAAPPGLWAAFCTALEFMTNTLGKLGRETWPVSGVVFFFVCLLSVLQSLRAFWGRPEERLRAAGLLAWSAGIFLLAAGLGYGRAFMGGKIGFTDRYMTLVAPYLALLYLQTILYSAPLTQRRTQTVWCLLLAALTLLGFYKAPQALVDYESVPSLQADMRLGIPPESLALRYAKHLAVAPPAVFIRRLETLRDARIGPYRNWQNAGRAAQLRIVALQPADGAAAKPVETVELTPGKSVTGRFKASTAAALYRLDVQIAPRRSQRFAGVLTWRLERIDGDGRRERLREGVLASVDDLSVDHLALRFQPAALSARDELALTLEFPPAAPAKSNLRVPLYAAPGGGEKALRGCAFFDDDAGQRP